MICGASSVVDVKLVGQIFDGFVDKVLYLVAAQCEWASESSDDVFMNKISGYLT